MEQLPMFADAAPRSTWRIPDQLPELGGYDELGMDCETTGLDVVHGDDQPVGISICTIPDKRRWYLPFGHRGGGNLDPTLIRRWAKTELRDKHLYNLNIKFEHHALTQWGVDLEAQGCTLHEVQHEAALLDERRRSFSLDSLAYEVLGKRKKTLPIVDKRKIADLPAALVGEYAEEDALLAVELHEALAPKIAAEDLEDVLALEDDLIFCVAAMERAGAPIDEEKLERWIDETQREYERLIINVIWRETKLRVNPDAARDMEKLYNHLGLPYGITDKGHPSFTKEALAANAHPLVQAAFVARQVNDLRTNFLLKYRRAARRGLLPFSLHQLRNDEYGTISGRFAASNVNIQQVPKPDKQPDALLRWIVRELFVPAVGQRWFSADASQIEFRLFAHYANSERLIKAYNDDPKTDFHDLVTNIIRRLIPDYKRTFAKNVNFCKVYGGGRDKVAAMLGKTREEVDPLVDAYDEEFPEVRKLSNQVSRLAERRGWVKTFVGRRRRFGPDDRFYSALNAVIQGTAADVMKKKLKELYDARKTLGITLRLTVHDEACGDIEDPGKSKNLEELLNAPSFAFRVPILWDVTIADNWRCGWQPKPDDGKSGFTLNAAPSTGERLARDGVIHPKGYSSSKSRPKEKTV